MKLEVDLYAEVEISRPEEYREQWMYAYDSLLQEASDSLKVNFTQHEQAQRKSTRQSSALNLLD